MVACVCVSAFSQLTCTNCVHADTTSYTNGTPNDSLYFVCTGQAANLVAVPTSGTPGWNFQWDNFIPASSSWNPLSTQNDVPTGSVNVGNGGYRVRIYDETQALVATHITWVSRVNSNPSVNINTIPAGCGSITLNAFLLFGNITPYYNPPIPPGPAPVLGINSSTNISICFNGTHTWVSDLAFYLIGPVSCGSPTVLLSPTPGSIGQNNICNSGDNFTNLCFSTLSTNNLNVCAPAPATLSGTYGTYGLNPTVINWSSIYGCNANETGWAVQVYDCVVGDIGALSSSSLSFSGTDSNNNPLTVTYSTPSGFNSPINDNSCSSGAASIFQVGTSAVASVPIQHNFQYQWTADPPFNIPNSMSALTINLNPAPTVDTHFTLRIVGANPGAACGGNDQDIDFFDYIDPATTSISSLEPFYCEQSPAFNLTSDQTDGSWNGQGITDPLLGTFDPMSAGPGIWPITYTPTSSCINPSTVNITVVAQPNATITPLPDLCSSIEPFNLEVDYPGGTWSGIGISNATAGTFDPGLIMSGSTTINYMLSGICPVTASLNVSVVPQDPLQLSSPQNILCNLGSSIALSTNVSGGTWSGTGITNSTTGTFNPQVAGTGSFYITYSYTSICFDQASINLVVIDTTLTIAVVPALCISSPPIMLSASFPGGVWSGTGITSESTGAFNPANVVVAGSYMIHYATNNACQAVDSVLITVQTAPTLSIAVPVQICDNALPVTFAASIDGGTWSGNGIINPASGFFNPATAGIGTSAITYTLNDVCTFSATANIQVNPTPNINAGSDVAICYNGSANLAASGAQNYTWTPMFGLSSGTIPNPVATPSVTTTYIVSGTTAGCSNSDQIVVTVHQQQPTNVNGPLTICRGDQAQLVATGLQNYTWTGADLSSTVISNPVASPQNTTNYSVTGLDNNGCVSTGNILVNVVVPVASFTASPTEGAAPLIVTFTNQSVGDSFLWEFGNGNSVTTNDVNLSPIQVFYNDNSYTVNLTVTLDGCEIGYALDVSAFYDSEIQTVPNIVTIDGNGENDNFRILSKSLSKLDIQIFDRWGKNVGQIVKPDGTWNPREFGTGTYYFVLKAEGFDNRKYDRSGYFTVLE